MIELSRVGLLLWSAMAVVVVVESQTLASFIGFDLSLLGMFATWVIIVLVLTVFTVRTERMQSGS